jgi:hypothetical protein
MVEEDGRRRGPDERESYVGPEERMSSGGSDEDFSEEEV